MTFSLRSPRRRSRSEQRVALAGVAGIIRGRVLLLRVPAFVALRGAVLLHHLVVVVAVKVQSRGGVGALRECR